MENQESSANIEAPFDVERITADDINMEDIASTQSSDTYNVQLDQKILALHILKYLPEGKARFFVY